MRVALVILNADPAKGGAEQYTRDLRDALRERKVEADILAAQGPADVTCACRLGGTRALRYRRFCADVDIAIKAGGYDVVHAMLPLLGVSVDVYHPHAGVAAERGSWLAWATNPRRRLFARAEAAHVADPRTRVIALSSYVGRLLTTHHPSLPPQRMPTIFNAVDTDRFRPDGPRADLHVPGDGPLALFVGNDWHRKGLGDVLRACAAADARLAVVGTETARTRANAHRLARRLGLANRVAWLGRRDDVEEVYRAADVFCHASRHDPCSLVTLEALASGVPVLVTDRTGAADVVEDGVTGHVVLVSQAAKALVPLLAPAEVDRLNASLLPRLPALRQSLAWPRHVEAVMDLYQVQAR